jgi:hypothetical protein
MVIQIRLLQGHNIVSDERVLGEDKEHGVRGSPSSNRSRRAGYRIAQCLVCWRGRVWWACAQRSTFSTHVKNLFCLLEWVCHLSFPWKHAELYQFILMNTPSLDSDLEIMIKDLVPIFIKEIDHRLMNGSQFSFIHRTHCAVLPFTNVGFEN